MSSVARSEYVVPVLVGAGAQTAAAHTAPTVVSLPFDAELVGIVTTSSTTVTANVVVDVQKNGSTVYAGANASAPKATIPSGSKVSPVSKAARPVPNSAVAIGAGGAQYTPGTNVIAPYTANDVALALLAAGDLLTVIATPVDTSSSDVTVFLHFAKK